MMSERLKALAPMMSKGMSVVGIRLAAAALAYAVVLFMARWLGPTDYGHFTLILSGVTLAAVIVKLGADVGVVRFLGIYRTHKTPALAEGLVQVSLRIVGRLCLGVALVVCLVLALWPGLTDRPLAYAAAAVLLFPAFALTDILSGVLRSYGTTFSALTPKDVFWRIAILGVGWLTTLLILPEGAALAFVVGGSGLALSLMAIGQFVLQRRLRVSLDGPVPKPETDMPAWRESARHLWVLLVSRNLFRTADVILVGALLSVASAGAYFAASRTAELLGFMLAALNMIVGPMVSRGNASGNHVGTQRKLSLVALFLLVTTVVLELAFILFGKQLLGIMDPSFVAAYPALLILSVGQCANVLAGSAGVVLNMTGHEKQNARILLTTVPITLILLSLLTPLYGLNGAASASAIGMVIWNARLWYAARTLTPYDPSALGILRLRKRPS